MFSSKSIEIIGYNGNSIFNNYAKQNDGSDKLAVVFSGFGYSFQAPLLYFSREILWEINYDILSIDFRYIEKPNFLAATEQEQDKWFEADCESVSAAINSLQSYEETIFLGKSLGTTAMLQILDRNELNIKPAKVIWLTPGTHASEIYAFLKHISIESMVVAGTKDQYFSKEYIQSLSSNPLMKSLIFEGADHCLEIPGKIEESLESLGSFIKEIRNFIGR